MKRLMTSLVNITQKQALMLVTALGVWLVSSSFYIEHSLGVAPCPMCLWQRYTHMAIIVLGIMGLIYALGAPRRNRQSDNTFFIGVATLVGLGSFGVGFYQTLGQMGLMELPASCSGSSGKLSGAADLLASLSQTVAKVPSCADVEFAVLGLSLANWNAIIMAIFVIIATMWLAKRKTH